MPLHDTAPRRNRLATWLVRTLALLIGVSGALLLVGGVYLISLGGSWYYAPAGLALVATAYFLFRLSAVGVWVYLLTFAATLAWALWEAGFNGWAQLPRLFAPAVLLVLVLLCLPVLRRPALPRGTVAVGLAVLGLMAASGPVLRGATDLAVMAQAQPPAVDVAPAPQVTPQVAAPAPVEVAPAPLSAAASQQPLPVLETGADWPAYGGTHHGTRHSPLVEITRENVASLQKSWEFRTGVLPPEDYEGRWSPENTPLKVGDDLFLCTPTNVVISVDARSGREEWRYEPGVPLDALAIGACRSVTYFEDPEAASPDDHCARRVFVGTEDARLIALDARMGIPCEGFGTQGQISLETGIGETVPSWMGMTSPPTIVRGVVVTGHLVNDNEARDAPSGVVRGFSAMTGELIWAWDLGNSSNRGLPAEGETYTRGTPNMWTVAAADEELGLVYLPLGNSAVDYYGSDRSEVENEYATSLVAVDVTTGNDVWKFQTVYRDVWDYDLGSQPALVDFPAEGETIPAIIVSSKQGEIYALNRATGESLFPVEERPVPQGGVEPDYLSPVQPFSTYHSVAMPPIEEHHMWGMTPLDQLFCRIQFREANYEGIYTPPTTDWYIQYPGYNGGQDWGSLAVDQERGIMIVNYNDVPNRVRLVPREEADERGMSAAVNEPGGGGDPQVGVPYAVEINIGWRVEFTKLLCKQPPYGGIRAVELSTGRTLWDKPFGSAENNGPFNIPTLLPLDIGTPNNGGPIVTAAGLAFIAATTDNKIRAFDIETGEELWSDTLPAGGQTTPIVYEIAGKQYLAIHVGGHGPMETKVGDYLIAWALPD